MFNERLLPSDILSVGLLLIGIVSFVLTAESINPFLRPRFSVARRLHRRGNVLLFAFTVTACAVALFAPRSTGGQLAIVTIALACAVAVGAPLLSWLYSRGGGLTVLRPDAGGRSESRSGPPARLSATTSGPSRLRAPLPRLARPPRPAGRAEPGPGTRSGREPTALAPLGHHHEDADGDSLVAAHDREGGRKALFMDTDLDMTIAEADFRDSDDTLSLLMDSELDENEAEPEVGRRTASGRRPVSAGGRPEEGPDSEVRSSEHGAPAAVTDEPDTVAVREALDRCQRDLQRAEQRCAEFELRVRGKDIALDELGEQCEQYREIARGALDKADKAIRKQREFRLLLQQERALRERKDAADKGSVAALSRDEA